MFTSHVFVLMCIVSDRPYGTLEGADQNQNQNHFAFSDFLRPMPYYKGVNGGKTFIWWWVLWKSKRTVGSRHWLSCIWLSCIQMSCIIFWLLNGSQPHGQRCFALEVCFEFFLYILHTISSVFCNLPISASTVVELGSWTTLLLQFVWCFSRLLCTWVFFVLSCIIHL